MTESTLSLDSSGRNPDEVLPPSPFAKYQGHLDLGGVLVDVYVLDTGDRVLSQRGAVKALTGADRGGLSDYLEVKALQSFLKAAENPASKEVNSLENNEKTAAENCSFFIPGAGWAHGVKAERFEQILTAYVAALNAGALATDRQRGIAMTCALMSTAFIRLGLIALIDEATGYQRARGVDALQVKYHAFVSDRFREWEKVFPDELWEQFGRLTNWQGPLHSRPKWWGHLVNELIYDMMDPDVAKYLRENKPKPALGVKYHQWLTADFGAKALLTHIYQIIGIAKGCASLRELKEKVALAFSDRPVQISMWLPRGLPK